MNVHIATSYSYVRRCSRAPPRRRTDTRVRSAQIRNQEPKQKHKLSIATPHATSQSKYQIQITIIITDNRSAAQYYNDKLNCKPAGRRRQERGGRGTGWCQRHDGRAEHAPKTRITTRQGLKTEKRKAATNC